MDKIKLPTQRFEGIPTSGGIRDIVDIADRLEATGRTIYHLEIGRPDFDSPKTAKDAAKKAIDDGFVHYADMRGVLELRQALSRKLKRENGMDVSPENITVTVGAQAALTASMMTLLNEGDDVIVPVPCFGAYPGACTILGANMLSVRCKMEDGFILRARDVEPLVTDRTRMIVINSPNNPTGAVIPRSEMEGLAEIARKHDLLVVSDECYERFLYGGTHVSIASLPGMSDRTVTVGSASKTYSMTGWRLGYMVTPPWMTSYANRTHLLMTTCAATFPQYGYAAALDGAEGDVKIMIEEYRERRDLVAGYLRQMKPLDFANPEGAFYILISAARTGMDATEFCRYILEEAGVALVPGEAFSYPGFVRMAYCKPKDYLSAAMESMKSAVAKLA
ncbi:MAG: pyridoxal phosphate-dependent aminotransferase [Synergistaceae bacterium]|nr:pyridoxal phosphate-dependent aminotransferase [Synergistaceae bacterium]